MSSTYHFQIDGQTEVVNKILDSYLKCMVGERPKDWSKWVPLVEWWYNTIFHSATQTIPYKVMYGQTIVVHLPYLIVDSKVEAVDWSLEIKKATIKLIEFKLLKHIKW